MADLTIDEFKKAGSGSGSDQDLPIASLDEYIQSQTITIAGTSASVTLDAETNFVRLTAGAACFVNANAAATTSDIPIASGASPEYFGVKGSRSGGFAIHCKDTS